MPLTIAAAMILRVDAATEHEARTAENGTAAPRGQP